jgi:hypothetical protein
MSLQFQSEISWQSGIAFAERKSDNAQSYGPLWVKMTDRRRWVKALAKK